MGIFSKSIPKYVHNHDYRNEVEITPAPEDVYVDDIFDPILNANVRNAMRQKYGEGLYGVAGGYSEMLKNVWTGNEGIFGKGMGLLSTFGRSMDKTGDVVLGTLTESVKGLTGQGFENPLENIFVKDEDYTGRRILAAAANSMRGLAGGTTVTEEDFGSAWTLPSTAIELATDPGILGGSLARRFTPNASKMSSKDLLKQVASGNAKSAVGSIGQLLDRYDDLMAKVAIDATAPGLRPALKGLGNQFAKLFQTYSPKDFVNVKKTRKVETPDAPDAPSPDVGPSTSSPGLSDEDIAYNTALEEMIASIKEAYDKTPVPPEEVEALANRSIEQVAQDVVANGPMNNYLHAREARRLTEDDAAAMYKQAVIERSLIGYKHFNEGMRQWNEGLGEKIDEVVSLANKFGIPIDNFGIDRRADIDFTSADLNDVRQIINATVPNLNAEYVDDVVKKLKNDEALTEALESGYFSDNSATNSAVLSALGDRKWEANPYYAKFSRKFGLKKSVLSKLARPEIVEGVNTSHMLLDSTRYRYGFKNPPLFNTPEELDKLLDSDNMRAVFATAFPPKSVDYHSKQSRLARGLEAYDTYDADYNKFKELLKKVYFPNTIKLKPGQSVLSPYVTALTDLIEFVERNSVDLSELTDESLYKVNRTLRDRADDIVLKDVPDPTAYVLASSPSEALFIRDLQLRLDEINQQFAQPLYGKRPKPMQFKSGNYSVTGTSDAAVRAFDELPEESAEDLLSELAEGSVKSGQRYGKKDFSYTALNDDEGLDLTEDLTTTYERYAQELFAQLAPYVKDQEMLDELYEPLKPYMELTVKKGLPAFSEDAAKLAGRLDMSNSRARDTVTRFYKEVLPLVEDLIAKGGNPYSDYVPKGFSKENMSKLKRYLGMTKSKHFSGTTDVDYPSFKYILDSLKSSDLDSTFNPKYHDLETIFKDVDDFDTIPHYLTRELQTPEAIRNLSKPFAGTQSELGRSASLAELYGQSGKYILDEYRSIADALERKLPELGIANSKELSQLLSKYNSKSQLTLPEFRKLHAYAIEYAKTVKQLPYHVIARDVRAFSQQSGLRGVWQALDKISKDTYEFRRLRRLIADESTALFNKGGALYKEAWPYVYRRNRSKRLVREFPYTPANEAFVQDNFISKLEHKYQVSWKPSKQNGLFYFDVHEGEIPDTIRIGEQYDIRPGDFQIQYRTGLTRAQLQAYNASAKYPVFSDYLDYTKLSGRGADSLIRDVAKQQMQMEKFEFPSVEFKSVADAVDEYRQLRSTSKNALEAANAVEEAIVQQPVETVVRKAYEPASIAVEQIRKVSEEVAPDVTHHLDAGGSPASAKAFYGEEQWELYEQIQKAQAIPSANAAGDKASLRQQSVKKLGDRATRLQSKVSKKDYKRFHILRAKLKGDVVKGSEFWDTFRKTSAFTVAYPKGSSMIEATRASLQKNADTLNRILDSDATEVVVFNLTNGNVGVTLRWKDIKSSKSDLLVRIQKSIKDLQKASYTDVVFEKPTMLTKAEMEFLNSEDMREYASLLADTQVQAAEQAKYLGFKFDVDPTYSKHVMRKDPSTAYWLNMDLYGGDLKGGRAEFLDDVSYKISNLNEYRQKDMGVFGTTSPERRIRGYYWQLEDKTHPLFYYTPENVLKGTLSEGMFANGQYQTFVDLFINDTFKIREWFETPDDLRKVLYAGGGNLTNLELVSYRLDENGKILGLTKYDKLSDKGLQKALNDPNTILVPATAVSHMDNLLRKDVRMKNKFWSFFNKHFTIPFKFGLLSNPGFLLGNISDSVLKTATTMSEKYGTTLTEEAANVAESIKQVQHLKNSYYTAFESFLKAVDDYSIKLSPSARIPDIVAMSPKYKQMFHDYLNGNLKGEVKVLRDGKTETILEDVFCDVDPKIADEARVHMLLQDIQMNSSKLREYEDLAGLSHSSALDIPISPVDKVLQGSGKYSAKKPSTWGIFMNNPVMKAITGASESWEGLIRSASILDDLKHKRYTIEDIAGFSSTARRPVNEGTRKFAVDIENAKATMYNAQFDYERLNDVLDGVGKVVPFPIFFLKNFTYWMDLFEKNPDWVDNAIDLQEGLWSGRDDDDDEFAKQAKGRGAVPVGGDTLPSWFKGIYKPTPLQSMFGAFSLLNDPLGDFGYRLHGLPSAAVTAVNKIAPNELTTSLRDPEETKYRPYSTDMYERNVKLTDPNYNPIKATVHGMNPFERQVNTYLRTPAKIAEGEAQLSDFLPSVFQPDFSKKSTK